MSAPTDIVVVGGTAAERDGVVAACAAAGLAATAAQALVLDAPAAAPAVLVVVGEHAADLAASARAVPALADVGVLAVVPAVPDSAAVHALASGASDVVTRPLVPAVLAARLRGLLRARAAGARAAAGALPPTLLRVVDELAQRGDASDALVTALQTLQDVLGFDRASLIAHIHGSESAFVIAATDDPTNSQFQLAIAEYPEVVDCIRGNQPVLIDDVEQHPATRGIAARLVARQVRASAVLPVSWRGRPLGVVLLRRARFGAGHIRGRGLEYARVVIGVLAGHLRHGAVIESLRDQTHRLSRARFEAERRLRGIESLREHFEASDDGVVILDEAYRVLFVNRAAERITGYRRDGLLDRDLRELVPAAYRELVAGVVAQVLAEGNHDPFDLQLATTAGRPATVAVSTSTVLASTGAVTLTFRDVTEQRQLESELRSTKEFLERLIDSTVDAIVAADLRGRFILFNQGAERLFGWQGEELVGQGSVDQLYPAGVAREIMRMLRSPAHGGVGRLEETRQEIRAKGGEVIPVNMTAAIVYEDGREVATVGVFSDLRERLRIEHNLRQAQDRLQQSEKQALVAGLAGAAAHELNQPLTSIIGYAQLVQRQSQPDAAHLRGVGVILREAERMAEIVRKIGRITRFETTEYVGGASILDLDRSAADPEAGAARPAAVPEGVEPRDESEPTREFALAESVADGLDEAPSLADDPAEGPSPLPPTPRTRRRPDDLDDLKPSDRELGLPPLGGPGVDP